MNFHFAIFLAGQDELVVLQMQVSELVYCLDAHYADWLHRIGLALQLNKGIMDLIVRQQYQINNHHLLLFSNIRYAFQITTL